MTTQRNQYWLPEVFNDLFDNEFLTKTNTTSPAINVVEKDNEYDVQYAAPGMTKDDFKVSLDDNGDLVINMEKKEENNVEKKHGHYLRREFSYSKFQQTMVLPDDVEREKINASVVNGVLKVNIPKLQKQEVPQAKKIIEIK